MVGLADLGVPSAKSTTPPMLIMKCNDPNPCAMFRLAWLMMLSVDCLERFGVWMEYLGALFPPFSIPEVENSLTDRQIVELNSKFEMGGGPQPKTGGNCFPPK